jgi:hypothetical protein
MIGGNMKKKQRLLKVFILMILVVPFMAFSGESYSRPVAVSPVSDTGIAVTGTCPTFSWSGVASARSYRIVVFEATEVMAYEEMEILSTPVISKEIPGSASSWTPSLDQGLRTGVEYVWYVEAVSRGGFKEWSAGSKFKVESSPGFPGFMEELKKRFKSYGVEEGIVEDVIKGIQPGAGGGGSTEDNSAPVGTGDTVSRASGNEKDNRFNVYYGHMAGYSLYSMIGASGKYNSLFGYSAGMAMSQSEFNTAVGYLAGSDNRGSWNCFIGAETGKSNTISNANTFIGYRAGMKNTGHYNVFLGLQAGMYHQSGNQNVFLGGGAGYNNSSGSQNIFIGYYAGAYEQGSNKLYIENSTTSYPLIYGEFDNNLLKINGDLRVTGTLGIGTSSPQVPLHLVDSTKAKIWLETVGGAKLQMTGAAANGQFGTVSNHQLRLVTNSTWKMVIEPDGKVGIGVSTPAHLLHLSGGAYSDGNTWTNASSRELKENITALKASEALSAFEKLHPVKFNYKKNKTEDYLGFIAEDVPELIATSDRKGLNAMDVVALLTKVIQEHRKVISDLKTRIAKLEK